MKKVIKLAVLSAMSTAIVFMPLNTTLADIAWYHSNNTMSEMKRETGLPSRNFSSHSFYSKHHSFDDPHKRHYFSRSWSEQQHHHVESKTYHYAEHKKTKHSNIQGGVLVVGVLGLVAAAVLSKMLKKSEQPQIIYQASPQNQIIYQKGPQKQVVYKVQPPVQNPPLNQSLKAKWLQYCKKKYRSFNPQTGTFRGSDGVDHRCYAPVN
ncbi:BA14K family protein [Bartonella vinsonii]|uniref:Lectin-like protein BA14k n=1 Tax=Bartonella vinsonii TaxID=33047 RepID=A0A3S4YZR5_BARVI|nr:BA14K family protein [Bartonella vinsonii]VEJ45671.1 BA14K-like protein [Bartonella vinsonii]